MKGQKFLVTLKFHILAYKVWLNFTHVIGPSEYRVRWVPKVLICVLGISLNTQLLVKTNVHSEQMSFKSLPFSKLSWSQSFYTACQLLITHLGMVQGQKPGDSCTQQSCPVVQRIGGKEAQDLISWLFCF